MDVLRLKELLVERKMTGKDLAEKVGVTAASISNISQGNSFPKPELLLKIAQALDVDVKELFHSTKEVATEKLFAFREGSYVEIGEIRMGK